MMRGRALPVPEHPTGSGRLSRDGPRWSRWPDGARCARRWGVSAGISREQLLDRVGPVSPLPAAGNEPARFRLERRGTQERHDPSAARMNILRSLRVARCLLSTVLVVKDREAPRSEALLKTD